MRIFRNLDQLPHFKNAVVTIGSFDGVHAGHQYIIKSLNEQAVLAKGESVLITFEPHPRLVVSKDPENLKLLSSIQEKAALLEQYGIQNLIVTPFTKAFASQSPESYIVDFLVDKFNPKKIVIGYDHRYGAKRAGDISYLKKYSNAHGFEVEEIPPQIVDDLTVSSTKIRNALQKGEIKKANALLGHPYILSGKVITGQRIGRTIGFPTANIKPEDKHKLIPAEGIYAVRVLIDNKSYNGMLYIGNRPTLEDQGHQSIEVNIFDFDQDIYGQTITIEFVEWIRGDMTLSNLDALTTQLKLDETAALKIFSQSETSSL